MYFQKDSILAKLFTHKIQPVHYDPTQAGIGQLDIYNTLILTIDLLTSTGDDVRL